ncbi:PEP/pyruvate-binding domain-containing protein [Kitasatospora sp. NPDC001660]
MTSERIVPLHEADQHGPSQIGHKARALARLRRHGVPVPDGVCLTSAWFGDVMRRTALGGVVTDQLATLRAVPTGTGRSLELIRRAVLATEWPEEARALVSAAVEPLLADGPVVVRSSVPAEDGADRSFAGVFHSEGPLESVEDVLTALRRCWAALWTARSYAYTRGDLPREYAAFVQRWAEPRIHGVTFTRDPLGRAPGPVTEASWGGGDTTEGTGSAVRVTTGEEQDGPQARHLPAELRARLSGLATLAEDILGHALDIEWVWNAAGLHVLQARPITGAGGPVAPPADRWWPDARVAELYDVDLGHLRRRLESGLQKHIWLRRQCGAAGVETYREAYAVYRAESAERVAEGLRSHLRTEFVQVNWSARGTDLVVPVDRLGEALAAGHARNPLADPAFSAVHLGEIVPAEASGFSTVLSDGTVIVEAFPAGLPGIKEGSLIPSVFTVDELDAVHRRNVAVFDRRCTVRPGEGWWWHPHPTAPYAFDRSDREIRDVARITRAMCGALGEARLEWYSQGERAMVRDVSLEGRRLHPLGAGPDAGHVIAGGSVIGTALVVPEIAALDDLARAWEVSVVGFGSDNTAIMADDVITSTVAAARAVDAPVIVAEYPSAGLIPLVDVASGFVFERGNLLCHTAIVLRERGVPAVVLPRARELLRDGQSVEISPAGVTVAGSGSGTGRAR